MVIHSCTSHSFSGLESYVLDLVTWQYRAGKPVELYCREGSKLEEGARRRGVPVWTIGANDKPGPLLWARLRNEWKKRLRVGGLTLHMHAGGEPWFHFPWLATKPQGFQKAILHFHIWINHRKNDPVHRMLYKGIDEVWTSSETSRAHLAALLPTPRERIRVVPYGRDVKTLLAAPKDEWRSKMRSRFNVSDDEMLAVCVSRIEPIKGVGELFDAFAQVAPKFPKAHLVIVGDPSPNNESAEALAKSLRERHAKLAHDVRRRLHMPGYLPEALEVMAAGDFYVLPSYEECMSLAMLDAVILGLPILGTNAGGTPSVARPEETGMLVPPANTAELARALAAMFSDPAGCKRLGEGAKALGPSFNQDQIFHQIWDWYSAESATKLLS